MLDGLLRFIQKVKNFISNVNNEVDDVIRIDSPEIVKMVQLQLAKGIYGGTGRPVTLKRNGIDFDSYAYSTRIKKDKYGVGLGQVTAVITNYMTGRFYASIKIEVHSGGEFRIYSDSPLYDIIKYRSGEDILNLTPESEQYLLNNIVAPDLEAEITRLYFA